MFQLEVVVMVISLRSETYLLDFLLLGIGCRLFLLFLLRVKEFLVVNHPANGWIGRRGYLDEVEVLLIGYLHSLLERVDALLYIIAYQAHLEHAANLVVNAVRVLFDYATASRSVGSCCYSFILLF